MLMHIGAHFCPVIRLHSILLFGLLLHGAHVQLLGWHGGLGLHARRVVSLAVCCLLMVTWGSGCIIAVMVPEPWVHKIVVTQGGILTGLMSRGPPQCVARKLRVLQSGLHVLQRMC